MRQQHKVVPFLSEIEGALVNMSLVIVACLQGLFVWECSSRVERPSPKRKVEGSSPFIPTMKDKHFIKITEILSPFRREEVVWYVS